MLIRLNYLNLGRYDNFTPALGRSKFLSRSEQRFCFPVPRPRDSNHQRSYSSPLAALISITSVGEGTKYSPALEHADISSNRNNIERLRPRPEVEIINDDGSCCSSSIVRYGGNGRRLKYSRRLGRDSGGSDDDDDGLGGNHRIRVHGNLSAFGELECDDRLRSEIGRKGGVFRNEWRGRIFVMHGVRGLERGVICQDV